MQDSYNHFLESIKNHQIEMENSYFNRILYDFSFFILDETNEQMLTNKITNNKKDIIIIDKYIKLNEKYIIICFDKTLILIQEPFSKVFLNNFQKEITIYVLKKDILPILNDKELYNIKKTDETFDIEIESFLNEFQIKTSFFCLFW